MAAYLSLSKASSDSRLRAFASFLARFFSSFASFFASFCLAFSAFSSSFSLALSAFSNSLARSFSFFAFCTSCAAVNGFGVVPVDVVRFVVVPFDVDDDVVDLLELAVDDCVGNFEVLGCGTRSGDFSNCVTIFCAHLQLF